MEVLTQHTTDKGNFSTWLPTVMDGNAVVGLKMKSTVMLRCPHRFGKGQHYLSISQRKGMLCLYGWVKTPEVNFVCD